MELTIIAIKGEDNAIESVNLSYDGEPEYVGLTLLEHYKTEEKVRKLISLGDLLSIGEEVEYDEDRSRKTLPWKNVISDIGVLGYGKKRYVNINLGEFIDMQKFNLHTSKYIYLFDAIKSEWLIIRKHGLIQKLENVVTSKAIKKSFDIDEDEKFEICKEAYEVFGVENDILKKVPKQINGGIHFIDCIIGDLRGIDSSIPEVHKIKGLKPENKQFPSIENNINYSGNIFMTTAIDNPYEMAERIKDIKNRIKQHNKYVLSENRLEVYKLYLGNSSSEQKDRYYNAFIEKKNIGDKQYIELEIQCFRDGYKPFFYN